MNVHKYKVKFEDYQTIEMPTYSQILSFHEQDGNLYIWVLADPRLKPETRRFRLAGTGHSIECSTLSFIGTAHLPVSGQVFHLFEVENA